MDTFIEVKRRINTGTGPGPNDDFVRQIDDYLRQSAAQGRIRLGVLTDGKHWLLRWPNAGPPKNVAPYAYTLQSADRWGGLHEWLLNDVLVSHDDLTPDQEHIEKMFGPMSPRYEHEVRELATLYGQCASQPTMRVKRKLWHNLLSTALGQFPQQNQGLEDLFIRHTYLVAVIGMALQARFGIDIRHLAEHNPADLLTGNALRDKTGLHGVVESDFFTWPNEVGGAGASFLRALARRIARFDWTKAPADVASILYEAVIPPDERKQLGEYYTPAWLARAMVRQLIPEPLGKTVLDPACGSGAFIVEAVAHLLEAAKAASLSPKDTLDWLRISVSGIDIHPVAVHLARASWALAAQPAIEAAVVAGFGSPVTVPIYLGDSLQVRFSAGDMFAEHEVTIEAYGGNGDVVPLVFPRSLVEHAENFDALMSDIASYIEQGEDPFQALEDNHIEAAHHPTLRQTITSLQELHNQGRDHIWAYYTRNLVRPVTLSNQKVDVVIGNPPWINYNQTAGDLRAGLEKLSRQTYGIWQGGRYASNQDVAGLFFARSVDLYLRDEGVIGMVMPHSALQTGQYSRWRTGAWSGGRGLTTLSVDFSHLPAWDLERLEPNTFFPMPASVVFAQRLGAAAKGTPLAGQVERWRGQAGSEDVHRESLPITDTAVAGESPYAQHSRQGAALRPRCLFFVEETENTAIIQAGGTVTVKPRRGSNDKAPWTELDLTAITDQTLEEAHVFDVHLGETLAPYAMLKPRKAVLPMRQGDTALPLDAKGVGGIRLGGLDRRMRRRWQAINGMWEANKGQSSKLDLIGNLDHYGKLSAQIAWQNIAGGRPLRVLYSAAGKPTAAMLSETSALVDERLYWVTCRTLQEALYLLAIINSDKLAADVNRYTTANWAGNTRDLHKHLWKLPIPEFSPSNPLHDEISRAGEAAAVGAAHQLERLRQERGDGLTVAIARRELRAWLRASAEGKAVEQAVARLLAG